MSTFSNRDLFRAAIINGLLSSGRCTLSDIDTVGTVALVGLAAHAYDDGIVHPPANASETMTDAATQSLMYLIERDEFLRLAEAVQMLENLGYSNEVARYAVEDAINGGFVIVTVNATGVPVLSEVKS